MPSTRDPWRRSGSAFSATAPMTSSTAGGSTSSRRTASRCSTCSGCPSRKAGKNRLHLDVYVDDPKVWIERAEQLGATRLRMHDDPTDWFCVMADPGGNELCICRENEPH